MTNKIQAAEDALKALEQHIHDAAISHFRMVRAERYMHDHADDPEEAAKFKADMNRHATDKALSEAKHAASGVTSRDIDEAAQAVLDARGEAHTELNVLPSGHGLRTVEAEAALAETHPGLKVDKRRIAQAVDNLARAVELDQAEKLAHADAGHARTLQGAA